MRILLLLVILLAPSVSFAQLPTAGEAMGTTETNTTTAKVTEHTFEAVDVDGTAVKPLEERIEGQAHGKTLSLIRVRQDFVPELLKSVEEI